jgi:hypothetical protein
MIGSLTIEPLTNAEMNVVKVKPQSTKNCEVNDVEESADVIGRCSCKIPP